MVSDEFIATAQSWDLKYHRNTGNLRARLFEQLDGSGDGTTGCEHVVDDEDPFTCQFYALGRDFKRRFAVFKLIRPREHRGR